MNLSRRNFLGAVAGLPLAFLLGRPLLKDAATKATKATELPPTVGQHADLLIIDDVVGERLTTMGWKQTYTAVPPPAGDRAVIYLGNEYGQPTHRVRFHARKPSRLTFPNPDEEMHKTMRAYYARKVQSLR